MGMPPVCFCKDGGPAVAMRCLKNGVAVIHASEQTHSNARVFRGDSWRCPACGTVVVLCTPGVSEGGAVVDTKELDKQTSVVASSGSEVLKLKRKYVKPDWIGEIHG